MLTPQMIQALNKATGGNMNPNQPAQPTGVQSRIAQLTALAQQGSQVQKPQSTLSKLASGVQSFAQSVSGIPSVAKDVGQGIVATTEAHGATENKVGDVADQVTKIIAEARKYPIGSKEHTDLMKHASDLSSHAQDLASSVNKDVGSLNTSGQALRDTTSSLLKTGSFAVGGGQLGTEETLAQQGAKAGATVGAMQNTGQAIEDNKSVGDTVQAGLKGAFVGGAVGGAVGKVTEKVGQAYQALKAKQDPIDKLITPEIKGKPGLNTIKTGKVVENNSLTGQRDFTQAIPNYNAMKESVLKVPGIQEAKTNLDAVNLIHDEIGNTAQNLQSQLEDSGASFTPQEFNKYLKNVKTQLAESPSIVGDAEKSADKIVTKFNSLVKENGYTPKGLLQARKELDLWIGSQKGDKIFNPTTENGISIALRGIRQGGNTFLSDLVPEVAVKDMLAHQTNLYNAIDNIAPKALKEGGSVLSRLVGTIKKNPVASGIISGVGGAVGADLLLKHAGL